MERINLSQLKLCDERWEDMTPNERGRLCANCAKTIIDFRQMSNGDIARTHAFSEESVCGVYRPEQMRLPKKKPPRYRINKRVSLFMASLGFLFSEQVKAQEPVPKERTIKREEIQKMQERAGPFDHGPSISENVMVTGKITDETGNAVPFATVHVQGTRMGTASDFDGTYVLTIPADSLKMDELVLIFKFVGYATEQLHLGKPEQHKNKLVVADMEFEEQSVIAFGVTVGPRKAGLWTELRRILRIQ